MTVKFSSHFPYSEWSERNTWKVNETVLHLACFQGHKQDLLVLRVRSSGNIEGNGAMTGFPVKCTNKAMLHQVPPDTALRG